MKFIDLTEIKFGKLKVLNRSENRGKGDRISWLCKCDCGNRIIAIACNLRNSHTKSCIKCSYIGRYKKHGKTESKIYQLWSSMKSRCFNKNEPAYKNYGERGITICDRWMDFQNFYSDMGDCPIGMTLDRVDNNGNYSPENCRWASWKEQQNNRRNNKFILHKGEYKTISQWFPNINVKEYRKIHRRIKSGWNIERAFSL